MATAVVALLGITGGLNISDEYLDVLFTALIIELVAAVIGLFKSTDWFGQSNLNTIKEIEGDWWQLILKEGEKAIGFVHIFYVESEQQVKLEGQAFTDEGLRWARFWSVAAALNSTQDDLYYFWQGDHAQSDEDFSGIGLIRFTLSDDLKKVYSGTGWFTKGDIFRADVTERKKVEYRRASAVESETMKVGNPDLQQQLVSKVRSKWPSACHQSSMEELSKELLHS
jgi:hypothetical protein